MVEEKVEKAKNEIVKETDSYISKLETTTNMTVILKPKNKQGSVSTEKENKMKWWMNWMRIFRMCQSLQIVWKPNNVEFMYNTIVKSLEGLKIKKLRWWKSNTKEKNNLFKEK